MTTARAQDDAGRRLLQLGIVLFLLGLLTGFAVPAAPNARMALTSHLEGLMNGTFLLVLGLMWPRLRLSPRMLSVAFWLAVYSTFANWLATLLAALWPAGSALMPIAGGGHTGTAVQEAILKALLVTLSVAMVALCAMLIYALRRPRIAG